MGKTVSPEMVKVMGTSEEESCPMCKRMKYLSPDMKMMVTPCGHKFCSYCVNRFFPSSKSPCPVCKVEVRRAQFSLQTFEDVSVQKEVSVRFRIMKDFNKRLEDFPSLREYNDYLEEIETIVFNLTNNVDIEETLAKIEKYQSENQELIQKNLRKQEEEEEKFQQHLLSEQKFKEDLKRFYIEQENVEARAKATGQESLIKDLMQSQGSVDEVVAKHKREAEKLQAELFELQTSAIDAITREHAELDKIYSNSDQTTSQSVGPFENYSYETSHQELDEQDTLGPKISNPDDSRKLQYSALFDSVVSDISCSRAIAEAYNGLFFLPSCPSL